jgi:hypothetical protein
MKIFPAIFFAAVLSLCFAGSSEAQTHRGQMDTDGILSAGEIPNPRIDYGARGSYGGNWDRRYPNYGPKYGWEGRPDWDRRHYDHYDNDYGSYGVRHDEDRYNGSGFSDALWQGIRSGRISRREEDQLRDEQQDLRRREEQYEQDGRISWSERKDLDNRRADLQKKLDHELNDGEHRW